jgi:hypothetical protein
MSFRNAAIAAVALFVGSFPAVANAATLTFSLTDLLGFSQLSASDPGTLTVNNGVVPAEGSVTISSIFAPPQSGLQSVDVGLSGLAIAFAAGDSFSLNLKNTNENPWTYQLVAVTDQGTFMSVAQSLAPGGLFTSFVASLGGVAGTISSVFFNISANVPFADGDRTAEYHISSVPLPPALLLFGGALLGFGGIARRRRVEA